MTTTMRVRKDGDLVGGEFSKRATLIARFEKLLKPRRCVGGAPEDKAGRRVSCTVEVQPSYPFTAFQCRVAGTSVEEMLGHFDAKFDWHVTNQLAKSMTPDIDYRQEESLPEDYYAL